LAAQPPQFAPAKPVLQAQVHVAGAPLTLLALPLHSAALLQVVQAG
jgi:hypothetical protein